MSLNKVILLLVSVVIIMIPAAKGRSQEQASSPPSKNNSGAAGSDNTLPAEDPNRWASEPEILPVIPLQGDPNEPEPSEWERPQKYWQLSYHPQVTQRVFRILNYPYHHGGISYPIADISALTDIDEPEPSQDSQAENPSDPNRSRDNRPSEINPDEFRYIVERYCDLIHQWRSINESPGTTLEIVRSIELTKTSTHIYISHPELAVQVKRTIGQIGRINHKFDLTGRMALRAVMTGYSNEYKSFFSLMEKQLADLQSMLDYLAEQNDQIGIALGLGKIDRNLHNSDPVNYSDL